MSLSEAVRMAIRDYTAGNPYQPGNMFNLSRVLGLVEPIILKCTLDYAKGNQSRTSRILGLCRTTIDRKVDEFNLREYAKRLRDMAKW